MSKNSFLVIFLLISFQISSNDVSIEIDISEQRLYLIEVSRPANLSNSGKIGKPKTFSETCATYENKRGRC